MLFRRAASTLVRETRYPYFLARNSRGSLPVYSDWKINGTKYVVEIRNVEGDANALKDDLRKSLFKDAERATRLKVDVVRGRHLKLTGLAAHYKDDVAGWLSSRGF